MDRLIEENDWEGYFNFVSRFARGQRLELEIVGLDIGDQIEEERAFVEGLSYDPVSETLFIHTYPLTHSIFHPREIFAIEEGPRVRSICVRDDSDNLQILSFREPLMLPASVF